MRVLILGAGYVGEPLASELGARGHKVLAASRRTGVDIRDNADLKQLGHGWDWIVNTVSSSKGGVEDYRRVFIEGTRNIIDWLSGSATQKYLFTSSTSVYGQTDGSIVDETSPTQPQSETSKILVETEQLLRGVPAIILRAAGIYGADRGHLFQQYLRGQATISGDGSRYLNMIHRDDVVRTIIAALERGKPGEIYNVTDDEPVTQLEFFQWLASTLNRPMPPFGPEALSRKRGVTNKRVSNRKLRQELRCELAYPNYRVGYGALVKQLGLTKSND
ncbi:MAG TPA: SDR family oxidoreductase [Verrucomicrobiae bacterium]|nr:SDR family oxidoreductase [Verrucomicrobiae bacterium]